MLRSLQALSMKVNTSMIKFLQLDDTILSSPTLILTHCFESIDMRSHHLDTVDLRR